MATEHQNASKSLNALRFDKVFELGELDDVIKPYFCLMILDHFDDCCCETTNFLNCGNVPLLSFFL